MFNHNPTTMHFICLVKSLHGLIIIRSEFRKKHLTFHHVSPKNLVFFIWASFIIALVSLLRSCALVFALRHLGFCQELDARSYCDQSFKLDFPLCVCQPASVKVFIIVWNACRASNDSQLFHCVGIKLKLGHFHMPLNCRRWVVLLKVLSIFEGSLLRVFGFRSREALLTTR